LQRKREKKEEEEEEERKKNRRKNDHGSRLPLVGSVVVLSPEETTYGPKSYFMNLVREPHRIISLAPNIHREVERGIWWNKSWPWLFGEFTVWSGWQAVTM
jgi:hypothetical protein